MPTGKRTLRPCDRCGVPHVPLSARDARFAEHYSVHLNGNKACRDIGHETNHLDKQTKIYLRKKSVQCYLDYLSKQQSERLAMSADAVLLALTDAATFDIGQLYDENSALLPVREWPTSFRKIVNSIKHNDDGAITVTLMDRARMLEMLGKHHRLFADVKVHEGELTLRQRMQRGRQRSGIAGEE